MLRNKDFVMEKNKPTGYPSIDRPWDKYYSEEVSNFQFPHKTMYRCMADNNANRLDWIAIDYFDRKITYEEVFREIDKTARALVAIGVKKGDIITIAMPTTPEVVYLLYAISKIGAIANMIDPRTSKQGIIDYTVEAHSKLFIAIDLCYPKIDDICVHTSVEDVIVISAGDSLPSPLVYGYKIKDIFDRLAHKSPNIRENPHLLRWKSFISKNEYVSAVEENEESDLPVAILHTGGTTGTPKGVVLSNESFNTIAYQYKLSGLHLLPGNRVLDIMPPFIAYGVGVGIHMPLTLSMVSVIVPKFDPDKFAKIIKDLKPNHMAGVPSHWGNIMDSKELRDVDLGYLVTPAVGGDGMNLKLEQKANEFLKAHHAPNNIIKGYGITEQCSLAAACINEINAEGSVGIPLPQNTIAIFDSSTGEELPYNQRGEVCISGPTIMIGYYNNPKATEELIHVHKDGKRWIHTGDLGYMTEDGFLYIDGRIKRVIIRNDGFKVFPFMIEETIKTHEAVDECMVVAIPDKEFSQGSLPKAHIILKQGNEYKEDKIEEELRALCLDKLPEYCQPVAYRFRTSFPLTPIGKVDFVALQNEDANR